MDLSDSVAHLFSYIRDIEKEAVYTSRGCNEAYLSRREPGPMVRRDGGRGHAQQPMGARAE